MTVVNTGPEPSYLPDTTAGSNESSDDEGPSLWFGGEYLLWWIRQGPLATPLVTTGAPGTNLSGAIGQPDTQVLFGGTGLDYGTFSGMRYHLGIWLDDKQRLGIEGSGFLLEQRSVGFGAGSDAAGNPPLYIPAFNVVLGGERALIVADPLQQFNGNVAIVSRTNLWGAEVNTLLNLTRNQNMTLDLLGGFRYLDLDENLNINNTTTDFLLNIVDQLHDGFTTRNQFYGGQLGARLALGQGPLAIELTGKVALGETQEVVDINGNISQSGTLAFAPGTFPGGFFTQPTNIGRSTNSRFSVIPEGEFKVSLRLRRGLRVVAGYNFLYWNQVVRPGDQIDRNLNLSQSPIFRNGVLEGQARPLPQFNRTDFWAHGVSLGVQVKY